MRKVVLASASPRRAGLLCNIGLNFVQRAGDVEENVKTHETPGRTVIRLATAKAEKAAGEELESALVIGADTIVVLDNDIIGKPADPQEARRILQALSGREHLVITGLCIIDTANGQHFCSLEQTRVTFRDLQDYEIEAYIKSGECWDKAGAYGIQGKGAMLVERIDGCYFNVVGLPLNLLRMLLLEAGQDIWSALNE